MLFLEFLIYLDQLRVSKENSENHFDNMEENLAERLLNAEVSFNEDCLKNFFFIFNFLYFLYLIIPSFF